MSTITNNNVQINVITNWSAYDQTSGTMRVSILFLPILLAVTSSPRSSSVAAFGLMGKGILNLKEKNPEEGRDRTSGKHGGDGDGGSSPSQVLVCSNPRDARESDLCRELMMIIPRYVKLEKRVRTMMRKVLRKQRRPTKNTRHRRHHMNLWW